MRTRRTRWLLLALLLVITSGCALVSRFNEVPRKVMPQEITRETQQIELQGVQVSVDIYHSGEVADKPAVILLHGFTRNRKVLAGLSIRLAREGFVALAMDAPFFSRHASNGSAVHELASLLRKGSLLKKWRTDNLIAYVGHSAGGYATLMAANLEPAPSLWVGLDPVDWNDSGKLAAPKITCAGLVLLAEPGPWNRHGNAAGFISAFAGPLLALKVKGSTHVDPEDPSSTAAEWVCGKRSPQHVRTFQDLTVLALRANLLQDNAAAARLEERSGAPDIEVLRKDRFGHKSLATPPR